MFLSWGQYYVLYMTILGKHGLFKKIQNRRGYSLSSIKTFLDIFIAFKNKITVTRRSKVNNIYCYLLLFYIPSEKIIDMRNRENSWENLMKSV